MSERQGIEIDYCPQCRGVWLGLGELDKITARRSGAGACVTESARAGLAGRRVGAAPGPRRSNPGAGAITTMITDVGTTAARAMVTGTSTAGSGGSHGSRNSST